MVHAPSQARALVADAKQGRIAPDLLLQEARDLGDPYHRAWAIFHISSAARMVLPAARDALREAIHLALTVAEPWRRVELVIEMASRIASWRGGDDSHAAQAIRTGLGEDWLRVAQSFPAGPERAAAIEAIAPVLPSPLLPRLLDIALQDPATGLEPGKAVLAAWMGGAPNATIGPALHSRVRSLADAGLSGRLFGHLHGQSRRSGLDPGFDAWAEAKGALKRLAEIEGAELLRYLATVAVTPADLEGLHPATATLGPEGKARALATLAARMDKLGAATQAAQWFNEAKEAAAAMPEGARKAKVLDNIATGVARLGGQPAPAKPVAPGAAKEKPAVSAAPATRKTPAAADISTPLPAADIPTPGRAGPSAGPSKASRDAEKVSPQAGSASATAPAARHIANPVLALHNGYDGSLKPVHLQAIARAAPLALGFGLDLALVGFPEDDLGKVLQAVQRETRIAEDLDPVAALAADGRIHLVGRDHHARPFEWGLGEVVATTQEPDESKPTDLRALLAGPTPVCIAMGLGHRGLPPQILRAVKHHLELTGAKVPLETATVMGIIAERVAALRRPSA